MYFATRRISRFFSMTHVLSWALWEADSEVYAGGSHGHCGHSVWGMGIMMQASPHLL